MRSLSIFFLLVLLFLFADLGEGRNPEDYWKKMMKGQEMPKALQEALIHDDVAHFTKDFDTKPNAIIYHSHKMGPMGIGPKLYKSFGEISNKPEIDEVAE